MSISVGNCLSARCRIATAAAQSLRPTAASDNSRAREGSSAASRTVTSNNASRIAAVSALLVHDIQVGPGIDKQSLTGGNFRRLQAARARREDES